MYGNELYQRVRKSQAIDGYVKQILENVKIDLSLNQPGYSRGKIENLSRAILASLQENDGFLPLTDRSPPPEIYAAFRVSKNVFKQAIGALYKQRRIAVEITGFRLVQLKFSYQG